MLDTTVRLETPEGAVLWLRPAGAPVRALAWSIDTLLRTLILAGLGVAASLLGEVGSGFYLISMFLLDWFYNVLFEVLRGATPGKRRMGLMVINDNGTTLTWSASLLRNLLRVVDFLPIGYGLGLVWSLFHPHSKRLGDLAAGTLVVYRDEATHPDLSAALREVRAATPPLPLDYATQQTILGFAERSPRLAPGRRIELAELLRPLHGAQGEPAVRQVLAYARQIAGRT